MAPGSFINKNWYCVACNGSQDVSPTGTHKERAACRYYQAGNCRRGSNCPFAHFSVAAQIKTLALPPPAYQAEHMYPYHPVGQTSVYRPLGSQAHPVFLWQPCLPPSSSFDPRYGLARQAETLPNYPDDKSDPSSPESSSTATSMDYRIHMGLDAAWSEGAESGTIRHITSPTFDPGINPSPGYAGYGYPIFPAVKAEYVVGQGQATSGRSLDQGPILSTPSMPSPPWQDDTRKKSLAYKTKPCKFYMESGKCSRGRNCTFIHDLEPKQNAETSPAEPAPSADVNLPPKPPNKYDGYRARDYYPITWRVIGGGVMMGGQRQICPGFASGRCKYGNDCKFAHETELEADQVGRIEPKNEADRRAEGLLQQPTKSTPLKRSQRGKSIKPPSTERQEREIFPSTSPHPQRLNLPAPGGIEAAGKGVKETPQDGPTSPVHRRTQSMSMVLSSPPPLDTIHSNYAAEL